MIQEKIGQEVYQAKYYSTYIDQFSIIIRYERLLSVAYLIVQMVLQATMGSTRVELLMWQIKMFIYGYMSLF